MRLPPQTLATLTSPLVAFAGTMVTYVYLLGMDDYHSNMGFMIALRWLVGLVPMAGCIWMTVKTLSFNEFALLKLLREIVAHRLKRIGKRRLRASVITVLVGVVWSFSFSGPFSRGTIYVHDWKTAAFFSIVTAAPTMLALLLATKIFTKSDDGIMLFEFKAFEFNGLATVAGIIVSIMAAIVSVFYYQFFDTAMRPAYRFSVADPFVVISLGLGLVPGLLGILAAISALYQNDIVYRTSRHFRSVGSAHLSIAVALVGTGFIGTAILVALYVTRYWGTFTVEEWRNVYFDCFFFAIPAALGLWAGARVVKKAKEAEKAS